MPTWLLLGIALATVAWYVARVQPADSDGFAPTRAFPALYLIWFALGSLNLVEPDADAPLWDFIPADIWIYVVTGLAAYLLGVFVLPRAPATWPRRNDWRDQVRAWNHRQACLIGLALLGLIAASYAVLARQGALALLSDDPGAARVEWQGPRIAWSVYHSALLAYVPLALIYVWVRDVGKALRRTVVASVAILLAMTLMFGNRSGLLEPALLAFLVWHYVIRPVTLRMQLTIAGLSLVFLSSVGIYRDILQWGPGYIARMLSWGFPLWSLPFTYMYSYMRDGVMTFHRLRSVVPDFTDYTLGAIHLAPIVSPLPGRQESADMVFKRLLHSEFVGFGQPATVLGPLYVDGGIVAIIAGMFLFGAISSAIYTRLHLRPSPYRVLLHIWVVHVAMFSLFTGLLPALTTVFVPVLSFGIVSALGIGATNGIAGQTPR